MNGVAPVKVVVDANVFFAGVIAKGKDLQSRTLDLLFAGELEMKAPYRMLAELEKHRAEIREKSGFSSKDFNDFVNVMKRRIEFVPLEGYRSSLEEAEDVAPQEKDAEFFALALTEDCPIWSEEGSFKEEQDEVEVYTTNELHREVLNGNG